MKRLVWILSAALSAAAAIVSLNALRSFGDITVYKRVAYPPPAAESRQERFSTVDSYSVIWEKGAAPDKLEPAPSHGLAGTAQRATREAPEQFILRSVFMVRSNHSVQGFAAIEISREEHLYSEGALIAGEYRLVAVNAGSVILERDGMRHTLRLEGSAEPLPEPVSPVVRKTPAAIVAEPEVDEVVPSKFDDPSGMPADRVTIPANVWSYAVNNLHKILRNVRVRTDLSSDNDMRGLWIDPHKNSLPYKFGFRIGDTIRSVDGKPMTSVKDVMELYRRTLEAPPERMRVIFERNGKLRVREIRIQKPPN